MTCEVKLAEEDILRVIRVVLPALNLAICKTRKLFSGEPSTTLKVTILLNMTKHFEFCYSSRGIHS